MLISPWFAVAALEVEEYSQAGAATLGKPWGLPILLVSK